MKAIYKRIQLLKLGLAILVGLSAGCGGPKGNIHKAAVSADLAQIKRIVAGGVDINLQDEKKLTALHIAAYHGQSDHIRLAKWMLENGADTSLKDFQGNTPFDIAEDRGNSEIAKIIDSAETSGGSGGKSGGRRQLMDGGTGVSEVIDL
jgi:hypothetical protein